MQPIRHSTYVGAPPERVYELLTTAEGWDAWFTRGAEVEARPGGRIQFRWVDWGPEAVTATDGGPVLEAVPAERFVFQWKPGDSQTTVAFDLTRLGDGTRLTVTETGHRDTEKDQKALVDCAAGWGEALTLLKFYLEHGLTYGPVPLASPTG